MGRLFGTDGARGVANREITPLLAMKIGKAAAMTLISYQKKHPTVLIGRDTRLSGGMLESALVAGLCSEGANVKLLGVLPTPAVSFLIKKYKADAGVMISASHNAFEFNGIKLFSGDGFKLPDHLENEIERIVLDGDMHETQVTGASVGSVEYLDDAVDTYIEHVISTVEGDLSGMRIALDCANGASSVTAEKIFRGLGAQVYLLHASPDGLNINDHCGSTHMESLSCYVREHHLDAGLAFDGDADRCLAVDDKGVVLDGDSMIAIFARDFRERGLLKNNGVVVTVMSNMGFDRFCDENGIDCVFSDVGDRNVLKLMREKGYVLGGEQCGHIILFDYTDSDDGQLTGAHLMSLIHRRKVRLSSLSSAVRHYPQITVNIKASPKVKARFLKNEEIKEETQRIKTLLGKTGKMVVRVSGTEPLIRVMIQGEDRERIERFAGSMSEFIRERLF